jgi:hypothetical protein
VLGGGGRVAAGGGADRDAVLGGRREVDVDRPAPGADDEPQRVGGLDDAGGEGRHLGDRDLDAVERRDQRVFVAAGLVDLRDRTERLVRPGQRHRGDVPEAERVGDERRGDEVVPGDQDLHGCVLHQSRACPTACR